MSLHFIVHKSKHLSRWDQDEAQKVCPTRDGNNMGRCDNSIDHTAAVQVSLKNYLSIISVFRVPAETKKTVNITVRTILAIHVLALPSILLSTTNVSNTVLVIQ